MRDFPPIAVTVAPHADADWAWRPLRARPDVEGFQERALSAGTDEVFIGGAKGPGKTDVLIAKPLQQAHKSAYAAAFVRESYKELQRVLDRAREIYGRLPLHQRPAWNGEKQRYTWPSQAFVQFGYAKTLKDITWAQGGNWAAVLYDELGNQPDERVAETLIAEIRCPDPTVRRQFIGSGNPGFAGHPWIKRRYITPCGRSGERVAWSEVMLPNGTRSARSKRFIPGRVTDNPIYANDASYMAALMLLPDRMRRALLDGDWDASSGVAFEELNAAVHVVKPFECPAHWPYIAAYDWGYSHPSVFGWGRVSDDGRVYVCDTIKRRLLRDWDLASTFNELVPAEALRHVHAGHDCWSEVRARGENAPQTAEYFGKCGIHLSQANINRPMGYANLIQYLAWQETAFLPQRQPMVQFFDTPTNRWLVEDHLSAMVMDPDDVRDVLKVNADLETGEGGDDGYDMLRYLLASRPMKAASMAHLIKRSAFDPDVLRQLAEKFRRPVSTPVRRPRDGVFLGG